MGSRGSGVEPRDNSIRLFFVLAGKRQRVTLRRAGKPLAPTEANIKHAHRVAKAVREAIDAGTFTWGEFFPDSEQARSERETGAANTFGEWCALWLETKGRCAKKTIDQYRNAVGVWLRLFGASTSIRSITHAKIAAKVGSHPWASAKLLNNYLIVLRGVFALACRELRIDNPTEGVENSKHQAPEPDPLTREEAERIMADMRRNYDPRVWAYFVFAFATGMRPEEQIALRWSDIDWTHKTALVQRAKTAGATKQIKTYQSRNVDLVSLAVEALATMKAHTFMLGPEAEVFQNPVTGRPWHDERSQRDHYWTPCLRRLGIRHRRAYQTRHTYATTALSARTGVNPTYVARQLGHRSAKMLFSVYSKWIDGADQGGERRKLEAALSGSQAGEPAAKQA